MNWDVFITCAITGSGDTTSKSDKVPVTPKDIAASAVEAAKAGAAIAHIHVRDPATGIGVRDVALYREVVERVRDSETDVVLNLTAGMGGDLYFGAGEKPLRSRNRTVRGQAVRRPELGGLIQGASGGGKGGGLATRVIDVRFRR